ncbi:MAG: hypothetical protein M1817_002032 [Caeruleum heppii]|nr:MAG: hypothetical protein M1817_002032 [Caeruleum heppii]
MLHDETLPFFPQITDCLSWSADCELAVAAGDHVQALASQASSHQAAIPKWPINSSSVGVTSASSTSTWDGLGFKVETPGFAESRDTQPLLSSERFTIGEEQSPSHVAALAWSPPGLGQYRRCVLGVLTTDHILSVWQLTGRSWRRETIINDALSAEVLRHHAGPDDDDVGQSTHEQRKAMTRVRSFAWSHPMHVDSLDRWGQFLLAIANDNNDMTFAQVRSPYELLPPLRSEWTVDLKGTVGVGRRPVATSETTTTAREQISRPRGFAEGPAWSPWVVDPHGVAVAMLAYLSDGHVNIKRVSTGQASESNREVGHGSQVTLSWDEHSSTPVQMQQFEMGILSWSEQAIQGRHVLAFACSSQVSMISFEPFEPGPLDGSCASPKYSICSFALESWDPIVGLTFNFPTSRLIVMTLESHIHIFYPDASTSTRWEQFLSAKDDVTEWQPRIAEHLRSYDIERSLDGTAVSRAWGLSSTPGGVKGDWTVAGVTFHPSDCVEYTTTRWEKLVLAFGNEGRSNAEVPSITKDAREMSAEAIMFDLCHQDVDTVSEAQTGLRVDEQSKAEGMVPRGKWQTSHPSIDAAIPYVGMTRKIATTLSQNILPSRSSFEAHLRVLLKTNVSNDSPATSTSFTLRSDPSLLIRHVFAILSIPYKISPFIKRNSTISARILYATACVAALILGRIEPLLKLAESTFDWLHFECGVNVVSELGWCAAQREHREEEEWGIDLRKGVYKDINEITDVRRHGTVDGGGGTTPDGPEVGQMDESTGNDEGEQTKKIIPLCEICGTYIGWVDPVGQLGRCGSGHVFSRCTLTHLPIQAPGITRRCGICNAPYLREDIVLHDDEVEDEDAREEVSSTEMERMRKAVGTEADIGAQADTDGNEDIDGSAKGAGVSQDGKVSLARILVQAVDLCLLCGGKFAE